MKIYLSSYAIFKNNSRMCRFAYFLGKYKSREKQHRIQRHDRKFIYTIKKYKKKNVDGVVK